MYMSETDSPVKLRGFRIMEWLAECDVASQAQVYATPRQYLAWLYDFMV